MKGFIRRSLVLGTSTKKSRYHVNINVIKSGKSESDTLPIPHINPQVEIEMKQENSNTLKFNSQDIRELVDHCWNPSNTELREDYSPSYPNIDVFTTLSDELHANLDKFFKIASHQGPQRMTKAEINSVLNECSEHLIEGLECCVQEYFTAKNPKKAQELHNMFINVGWLEKYWMFAEFFETKGAESFIPKSIARPYLLLSHLFGNHPEFTYYTHYVGASCGNMDYVRKEMKKVLFNDSESIVTWVNSFKPLYSFQPLESNPDGYQAEKYFRFIHLAMEMVYSKHIQELRDQLVLGADADKTSESKRQHIEKALDILYKIETDQNAVFKTLKSGSDPKLYNGDVRPFIAGTWGKNCGTVFHDNGKFFEGCHIDKWNESTLYPDSTSTFNEEVQGVWKKHVGQTGAGTTVRPICDEYAGGVSRLYNTDTDLSFELVECLMTDNLKTVLKFSETMNPLGFMLTSFRAISRPYSHNQQIILAKEQISKVLPAIMDEPKLLGKLLRCQTMALVHRLDHYNYVNAYINAHAANTAQLRSVATGGSQTSGFLPDLIMSNIAKANSYLQRYGETIKILRLNDSNEVADELQRDYNVYSETLTKFDQRCKMLLDRCKSIETRDDELIMMKKASKAHTSS